MNRSQKAKGIVFNSSRSASSGLLSHSFALAGVALIYFAAAELGLSLASIHGNVSPVWPPTGVAIAAILLLGFRVWPGILLGALLANILTPVSIATAGGIAVGNTLEAVSAGLLLRSSDFRASLERVEDVFRFVVVVSLCTMISATLGTVSLSLGHSAKWGDFGALWMTWWLGDLMGALVVAPLLLTWHPKSHQWTSTKRYIEAILLMSLLSVASMAMFAEPPPFPLKYYPAARLIVPFFLWASLRLGQRGVTLASITISVFAIWGTANGLGPFTGRSPNESLLVLQVFLGSNVVMFLFLAATVEERRRANETLRESERRIASNLAVTKILAESPALSDATPRILKTVGETLNWKVGALWSPNSRADELQCRTIWHADSARIDNFKSATLGRKFGRGAGLPGRVWSSLKPVWVPDATSDDNFPRAPEAVADGLHSAFAFPILFGDKFLGVMEFFSSEIRKPDDALLAMFGIIGNQIGQFIERKHAEEDREQLLVREHAARAEAELANRAKDEFLAVVSHELRTPLSAIVGWSRMLRSGTLDKGTTKRGIEVIDRNAQAQAQLIEDLLDVSRIVSGNLRIDPRPVNLHQVIDAAVESVRPTADSKDIRLRVYLDPKATTVSGDADRLQQVVWNLLSNSVKFTPAEGEIDVQLTRNNSHVEIVVTDTGIGIQAEFLPHVFDRFRQADGSKTRRHGGLGLGLAIVRNLVELHGGRVFAESDGEGKGTRFTISLPCLVVEKEEWLKQRPTDGFADSRYRGPELEGLRILSVDDDPDARDMLEFVLTSQRADVISVGSVKEAMQILNDDSWRPDVLLSDLGMPDEDGYDLIRKLRSGEIQNGRHVPAVAITGYAGKQERERALNAGFQTHLTKPVDWNQLVEIISSVTGRKEAQVRDTSLTHGNA